MTSPRFKISPPTTTGDIGGPSESCTKDAERVFRFIEDERHLSALALLRSVQQRVAEQPVEATPKNTNHLRLRLRKTHSSHGVKEKVKDFQRAKELLDSNQELLLDLEERCRLFHKAKQNLNVNDDWTLAQTLFGVTTYYRREVDGSLSIKLEGSLDGVPLFDQVAVLREVDLHHRWAPFCSSSLTVAHLAKLDTVGWFVVGLPQFGLMRDACFRVIGSDSIHEDGSILLVGQGIADKPQDGAKGLSLQKANGGNETVSTAEQTTRADQNDFEYLSKDPVLNELELPEPPTRIGSGRMTIRSFQAIIHVESPTRAQTRIIANVDPNLPLIPQSLLDFLMKKLCGVLLSKLQSAAKKVSKDPVYNPHACKMREEEDFYKGWLMAKFQSVCEVRGWQMPPVSAFELTDQQLELATAAEAKRNRNKSIKLYHSLSGDKLDHHLESSNHNSKRSEPANVGQSNVGSPIRAMTDSDSVSELSQNSGSTFFTLWKNNPIARYMRELEEKTELRKAREVEISRERAANRLKPRSLDNRAASRLRELQAARKRREYGQKAGQKPVIPVDATKSQRNFIEVQHKRDWATFWTCHGVATRVAVMLMLVASLFSLLYMDPLFEGYMASRHGSWWGGVTRDLVTLIYLSVSATVHFTLCYVALMYAFSALQIGSIAGREAKRYYSENIHLVVGVSSGSMVLAGMIKASATVMSRWLTWKATLALGRTKAFFNFFLFGGGIGLATPDFLESTVEVMYSVWNTTTSTLWSVAYGTVVTLVYFVEALLIKSNPAGRFLGGLCASAIRPLHLAYSSWNDFVGHSVAHYERNLETISWREDAYVTTRVLLSYSAFFLLVLLTLFNIQARSARRTKTFEESAGTGGPGDKVATNGSNLTSLSSAGIPAAHRASPKTHPRSQTRSLSPRIDTIEEGSKEGGVAEGPRSLGTPKKQSPGKQFFKKSPKLSRRATASM